MNSLLTKSFSVFLAAGLAGCVLLNPDYDPNPSPDLLQDRRVFVTRATFRGSELSDYSVAGEYQCATAALLGGLGGKWVPWLSSQQVRPVDAIDRVANLGPWRDLSGTVIFANRAGLADVPLAPLVQDERGEAVPVAAPIWTGAVRGGQHSSNLCYDKVALRVWYSVQPSNRGDIGRVGRMDAGWTQAGMLPCTERAHLICLEQ